MRTYATKQRLALLTFFENHDTGHFTIEEISARLEGVSLSAIYRNVNTLLAEGLLRRFQKEGSRKFVYQYMGQKACKDHLHLKCTLCGTLIHLEEPEANELIDTFKTRRGFSVDIGRTIVLGRCSSCQLLTT